MVSKTVLTTPDGRYIIVNGRLWRHSNPALSEAKRASLVEELMEARRLIAQAYASNDDEPIASLRSRVNAAKLALGERGPVWWVDGSPDLHRRLIKNTPYARWYAEHADSTKN